MNYFEGKSSSFLRFGIGLGASSLEQIVDSFESLFKDGGVVGILAK